MHEWLASWSANNNLIWLMHWRLSRHAILLPCFRMIAACTWLRGNPIDLFWNQCHITRIIYMPLLFGNVNLIMKIFYFPVCWKTTDVTIIRAIDIFISKISMLAITENRRSLWSSFLFLSVYCNIILHSTATRNLVRSCLRTGNHWQCDLFVDCQGKRVYLLSIWNYIGKHNSVFVLI